MTFVPFVMESLGGFGDACDTILVKIGRALADIDRTSRNRAVQITFSGRIFTYLLLLNNYITE